MVKFFHHIENVRYGGNMNNLDDIKKGLNFYDERMCLFYKENNIINKIISNKQLKTNLQI